MIVDLLDDESDPSLRGTVYGLIVVTIFCATCLAIGAVLGLG